MAGILIAFLGGVIAGLISNYLADVLPRTRKLTEPVCLDCGEKRKVSSFLVGADCQHCGKKNQKRYWLVLFVSIVLSNLVWLKPAGNLPFALSEILIILFLVVITTDVEYRVILEQVSFAGYLLCAGAGWLLNGISRTIIGGLVGFLIFFALYYFGRLFARRMSKSRGEEVDEDALGFGDVHLAAIIGLLTGFPLVFSALLYAIVIGGLISGGLIIIALIKKDYHAFQAIPYGPFIIIGGIISFYFH